MENAKMNKIILITRKTRLENLIHKYNTIEQAKFYLEHQGLDFSDYLLEDKNYREQIRAAEEILGQLGRLQVLDRDFIPNMIFGKEDVIVVIGQDGLVANTLKYLDSQMLIGVNPDPARWDGVLLPFTVKDLSKIVPEVFSAGRRVRSVTIAEAKLNDGQSLYGVNDLFIGQKTHVSARYRLIYKEEEESQSSSGIIVSTGLGSTGWLKSIQAEFRGIAKNKDPDLELRREASMSWESDYLRFTVREPYPSKFTGADIVYGKINKDTEFKIESQMPENGVIFSDGVESDFLEFNSGAVATIGIADKKGCLFILVHFSLRYLPVHLEIPVPFLLQWNKFW